MILNPIVKCVTSNFNNHFISKETLQIFLTKIAICNFGTSNALCKKKKKCKKIGWFWKKKEEQEDKFKIIRPGNCADHPTPILNPLCKVAVIVGGSKGFGYAAADELLSRGARNVVIADKDNIAGNKAVQRLCDAYGKDRASFMYCDIRDSAVVEGVFTEILCRHREIHILFSDLDQNQTPLPTSTYGSPEDDWSNTRRASVIGLKFMGTENGGRGGIIVNCASILGFMGWPQNPTAVYCKKEPVIEVTMNVAEEHPVEKTGVRFVTLCPTNKQFEKIGLPDFPQIKDPTKCITKCLPPKKITVGPALTHVIAWANTGSTWLVPPFPSQYVLPRLIHFPKNPDKLVDPKVYDQKTCPVGLEPHCARILEETTPMDPNANCGLTSPKLKCKKLFSRKKK